MSNKGGLLELQERWLLPVANAGIKIVSALVILVLLAFSIFVYKASVLGLVLFLLYLIIYVILPGRLLLKICSFKPEHGSSDLLICTFLGWALIVIEYFLSDATGFDYLLYSIAPLMSVTYIFLIIKESLARKDCPLYTAKRNAYLNRFFYYRISKLPASLFLFVAIVLVYTLLRTQFLYLSPEYAASSTLNPDKYYHIGLINALSQGYPIINPWIQGRVIHYHVFAEILYCVPVKMWGLDSDFILMSCAPWFTVFLMSLSLYALFREFSSRKNLAGIYTLTFGLSYVYVADSTTTSSAFKFLFVNDNSAGYGAAAAIAFVIMLKYCSFANKNLCVSKKNAYTRFVFLLLISMLSTGIKGPMGLAMIGSLCGTYLLGLILKECTIKQALPVIFLSLSFYAVYKFIFSSSGQTSNSSEALFRFAVLTNRCFWKAGLIEAMKSVHIPGIVRLIVIMLVFMAFFFGAYLIPFTFGYIRELWLVLTRNKSFDFVRVTIYAAALCGLLGMLSLNYSGDSQIYFGFITLIFAPLISFWFFEDVSDSVSSIDLNKKPKNKLPSVTKAIKIIFVICLIAGTAVMCKANSQNIPGAVRHADSSSTYDIYKSVSNDEYDAMKWIEDNTPEDSLLAIDRYYSVPLEEYSPENRWENRFFLYADYSCRCCYFAGAGYSLSGDEWTQRLDYIENNNRLYDASDDGRAELANELGVDYVVVSNRFTDCGDLSNDGYTKCYSNDDIVIYEIH